MANSKLLKEAIADAKTVRETAIANAKIALEEAFTPRLQKILSQKLQTEMEDEENEDEFDVNEEYGSEDAPTGQSSSIGKGENGTDSGTDGKQPSGDTTQAHTDLDPETGKISDKVGTEDDNVEVVSEGEGEDEDGDGVIDDPTGASVTEDDDQDFDFGDDSDEDDSEDDDLDLESIIRELEDDLEDDSDDDTSDDDISDIDAGDSDDISDDDSIDLGDEFDDISGDDSISDDDFGSPDDSDDDDIDLDEILREMGYGVNEDEDSDGEDTSSDDDQSAAFAEKEAELEEAYKVIRSLKGTINEVNLLNAKLLYSNKLFRNYELTNEQKMKVVETLDRTHNVREVKLVFATLAESLKYGKSTKKRVKKITENFASSTVKSTAPKKIITESNEMAKRFQQLANIQPSSKK